MHQDRRLRRNGHDPPCGLVIEKLPWVGFEKHTETEWEGPMAHTVDRCGSDAAKLEPKPSVGRFFNRDSHPPYPCRAHIVSTALFIISVASDQFRFANWNWVRLQVRDKDRRRGLETRKKLVVFAMTGCVGKER